MEAETIVSLITSCGSAVYAICATIIFLKKAKKQDKQALNNIIKAIPGYIAEANTNMPGSSTKAKINYILAEIKEDCEEMGIKFCENKLKKEIEEAITNE